MPSLSRAAESDKLCDKLVDGGGVERLRSSGGEDSQADIVLTSRGIEISVLIHPPSALIREKIDLHYLKRVAHTAPGVFQCLSRKPRRPWLRNGGLVRKSHAGGQHAGDVRVLREPLVEQFFHPP